MPRRIKFYIFNKGSTEQEENIFVYSKLIQKWKESIFYFYNEKYFVPTMVVMSTVTSFDHFTGVVLIKI